MTPRIDPLYEQARVVAIGPRAWSIRYLTGYGRTYRTHGAAQRALERARKMAKREEGMR